MMKNKKHILLTVTLGIAITNPGLWALEKTEQKPFSITTAAPPILNLAWGLWNGYLLMRNGESGYYAAKNVFLAALPLIGYLDGSSENRTSIPVPLHIGTPSLAFSILSNACATAKMLARKEKPSESMQFFGNLAYVASRIETTCTVLNGIWSVLQPFVLSH